MQLLAISVHEIPFFPGRSLYRNAKRGSNIDGDCRGSKHDRRRSQSEGTVLVSSRNSNFLSRFTVLHFQAVTVSIADGRREKKRKATRGEPGALFRIVNRNLYKYRIRARNASHRRLTLTISFAPTPAPATFFTVPRRTPCFCTLPAPPSRAAATFYFETLYILYPIRPLPSRRGSFGAFHASRLT